MAVSTMMIAVVCGSGVSYLLIAASIGAAQGRRGAELLPHRGFWAAFFGLVYGNFDI